MIVNRRQMLKILAGSASGLFASPTFAKELHAQKIKAVAFDAFPIFDPRPIFKLVETMYPKKGKTLNSVWKTRQFEYQWLRALSGKYVDFWQATDDALRFATKQLKINMSDEQHATIMNSYLNLKPWPDVISALKSLQDSNIRLAFLSNMTPKMLTTNIHNSGLDNFFEHIISTDIKKTYKPSQKAYQLGVDTLKLQREEIAFAAFAGWDVAGAKWFGYPTFWVNRAGFMKEELGVKADKIGNNLNHLIDFIKKNNP